MAVVNKAGAAGSLGAAEVIRGPRLTVYNL